MRGWSLYLSERPADKRVFPVYAGVILVKFDVKTVNDCVPRVCGGDPIPFCSFWLYVPCSPCMRGWSWWSHWRWRLIAVFPVYAGVIPTTARLARSRICVPRVCGGDPCISAACLSEPSCSPCMRGWSFSVFTSLFRSFVFPVRTGVLWIYHDNNMEYKRGVRFEYFFSNNFTSLLTFYKFNDLYKKAWIK